jgi:bud site selection protein 31
MSRKWNNKNRKPPSGFDVIEPVLEALENELRDKVKESNVGKRKTESLWPVHQINWQKSRYVYDMYYTHSKISRAVYDYCIQNKLVDSGLIAKWKKPGYERLCSTFVINPTNFKFGTTSICRVPWKDRSEEQKQARDPTTGCMGCASGKGAGPRNIFGNKYGQNLAAVQVAREKRMQELQALKEEEAEETHGESKNNDNGEEDTDDDDDEETDEEDYGPSPAAGVWAASQKLQTESEALAEDEEEPPSKKLRTE